MSKVCQKVCIVKSESEEAELASENEDAKENNAAELTSDKKTDQVVEPEKPVGLLWRLSSGIASTSKSAVTGTVGLGVSGVKWVAGKSYDAGSAVVSGTISGTKAVANKVPVSVPFTKKKDKKE